MCYQIFLYFFMRPNNPLLFIISGETDLYPLFGALTLANILILLFLLPFFFFSPQARNRTGGKSFTTMLQTFLKLSWTPWRSVIVDNGMKGAVISRHQVFNTLLHSPCLHLLLQNCNSFFITVNFYSQNDRHFLDEWKKTHIANCILYSLMTLIPLLKQLTLAPTSVKQARTSVLPKLWHVNKLQMQKGA